LASNRVVEVAHANRNATLESMMSAQAQKIAELEAACTSLRHEKENITAGYRRLSDKHKVFVVMVEQEKAELAEAHAAELAGMKEELDKETKGYTDYRLNADVASSDSLKWWVHYSGRLKRDAYPFRPGMPKSKI
jgi:uncharacterized coiled-coil protein SlyX